MNYIEFGFNKKKLVYIISDSYSVILKDVLHEIGKGVTIVPIIGAHKKNNMQMLMIAVNKRNYDNLLKIVNKHDEKAFMITDTVSDIHGYGFTYESGSI